ncbi:hypothetical protein [Umezawaea sp. NPDC059074]|uniref:hypothetical protein n=1 Tax=Umezawaea sp. NPDC059074 TaxID=3346716 RepID=UPI0036CF6288
MSELLWVAVPSGLDGADALIRVLVVPRLEGNSLDEFGLRDWPTLLEGLSFRLRTDTSAGVAPAGRPVLRPAARSDVWQAFFGGSGGLINDWSAHDYDPPRVHPTHTDAAAVTGTYRRAVTDMARRPQDSARIVDGALSPWQGTTAPAAPPEQSVPTPVVPDFHRTVAMLREHPAVLRDLGLVFELAVPRRYLDVGDPRRPRHLSVRCDDPVLDLLVRAPWTAYLLDQDHFLPSGTTIQRGVVDLAGAGTVQPGDSPAWAVCTFEVDGAVGGLREAANSSGDERPATLPHLRSAGLQLVRPGRLADYTTRANAARVNAASDSMDDARFTAEDLVLGYRLDVRTADGPWRSLTHRLATYTVDDLPIGAARTPEEGHVKPFSAVRDAGSELRADEVVTRWNGWSHAVSPTNLLDDTPGPRRDPAVPLPYEFAWRFELSPEVPLPALRFGTSYQLRVRVADATGGGLPLETETEGARCSDAVRYTRHEPVPPPLITASTDAFAPGAAITTLVIRGDQDVEQRALHPPTATFEVAEQHGVFDPPASDEQTWEWAQRALRDDALPDPAAGGVNAVLRLDSEGTDRVERWAWSPAWPEQRPKRIELAASADPAGFRWSGDGGVLQVRLGPGEQATLRLSSTVHRDRSNHFSLLDWLADAHVDVQDALDGRHPQLTPPRVLRVVHAVRAPTTAPEWVLRPGAIDRTVNDTTALVNVNFSSDGLHTPSTATLDVGARWTEWTDSGDFPASAERLHSQPIVAAPPNRPPAFTFRHEFGDTKHRRITYTLTAISRYRHCFDASEPESAFRVKAEQRAVAIPSSARPAPPVVLAVSPAFAWETGGSAEQLVRVRRGRRVRVELAPPWYETGEGEQLAVLTPVDDPDGLTRLARDPLWGTTAPPRYPAAAQFPRTESQVVTLPGPGKPVRVVPFTPVRHGDRWFADVEVTTDSYAPFAELVVARYQPHSVEGMELSTAVTTDPVPLLPDRTLVVRHVDDGIVVTLTGVMPHPPNRVEAVIEVADSPTDLVSLTADTDVPAWRPVIGPVVGSGNSPLPQIPLPPGWVRVRVREIELLTGPGDDDAPRELQERTTFVDSVLIPPEWQGV